MHAHCRLGALWESHVAVILTPVRIEILRVVVIVDALRWCTYFKTIENKSDFLSIVYFSRISVEGFTVLSGNKFGG